MVNFRIILVSIFILTFLVSCESGETKDIKPQQETPKALQDTKSYSRSSDYSNDLTEELYQELVQKNPALKKLEKDLDAFNTKRNNLHQIFQKYSSKSDSYYGSANYTATTITDSLLRNKMIELISASNTEYSINKTKELNSLLMQISKDGATLHDRHSVLKIVLTLPIIEKYQDNHIPDKNEFKDVLKQQESLILQTDSLIPKY